MDLKAYYQRIRDLERSFEEAFPVVVSLETPDGGTGGVKTEVPMHIAAKMIVEGRARLANGEEVKAFEQQKLEAKRAVEQMDSSRRLQVTVVSDSDLRAQKGSKRSAKQ